jgi:Family of unknown function (DUF5832)
MANTTDADGKEVYLEADKEIPGQHYVALSFISPQKVLKNKDVFLFSEFLKDYEVEYKIKSTEGFMMSEVRKVQDAASSVQDVLENMILKKDDLKVEDLSGALQTIKTLRRELTSDVADDLKEYVKKNVREFKEPAIQEAYDTFLFKNKKKLEDDFFAKNNFRTTVQGIKVRGVYDTYNEAVHRCKTLQKLDPSFNVYVGQVGFWLPWDPEPSEIQDQEYADEQLNTLMKSYKENEQKRDELYAEHKILRMNGAKPAKPSVGAVANTTSVETGTVGPADVGKASIVPTGLFDDDDLVIRRKKEKAAAAAAAMEASVLKTLGADTKNTLSQ